MASALQSLPVPSGPITYDAPVLVGGTDKLHERRLRRQMASARVRVAGTCEEQGRAIGRRHTAIVARRQGKGPDADLALEIDAYESRGISTDAILVELALIQQAARRRYWTDDQVRTRLLDLIDAEHELEAAENRSITRFAASGDPALLVDGLAPETDAQAEIRVLAMLAQERRLVVRR